MAVLIQRAIERLYLKGLQTRPAGNLKLVIEALGDAIERAKDFLGDVRLEALPGTADDTLDLWEDMLGLAYYEDMDKVSRQDAAETAMTAIGGASLDYIDAQVKKKFPQVYLEEAATPPNDFNYYVKGYVITAYDLIRLYALMMRIAPLHLVPNYAITIIEDSDTAFTGVCITGKAVTGRTA